MEIVVSVRNLRSIGSRVKVNLNWFIIKTV
jgi:hypothetical protein